MGARGAVSDEKDQSGPFPLPLKKGFSLRGFPTDGGRKLAHPKITLRAPFLSQNPPQANPMPVKRVTFHQHANGNCLSGHENSQNQKEMLFNHSPHCLSHLEFTHPLLSTFAFTPPIAANFPPPTQWRFTAPHTPLSTSLEKKNFFTALNIPFLRRI